MQADNIYFTFYSSISEKVRQLGDLSVESDGPDGPKVCKAARAV